MILIAKLSLILSPSATTVRAHLSNRVLDTVLAFVMLAHSFPHTWKEMTGMSPFHRGKRLIQITRPGESWGAILYLSDSMVSALSSLLSRDGSQPGPALSMWGGWGWSALHE